MKDLGYLVLFSLYPLHAWAKPVDGSPRVFSAPLSQGNLSPEGIRLLGAVGCKPGDIACENGATWIQDECASPQERHWKEIPCTDPLVNDTSVDPKEVWDGLHMLDAWCDVLQTWPKDEKVRAKMCPQKNGKRLYEDCFAAHVSQVVKGTINSNCGALDGENGCHEMNECRQNKDAEGNLVTGAAVYQVYNSMATISSTFWNLYHSLDYGANNFEAHFDLFLERFAKKKPNVSELLAQLLINAAGLIGGGAVSGVFNTVVKVGQRAENIKEATKDMGYAWVAAATASLKDSVTKRYKGSHDLQLRSVYLQLIGDLRGALQMTINDLFSGDKTNLQRLHESIKDGAAINMEGTNAPETMQTWEKMSYTFLIPQSWKVLGITPVVLTTGKKCDDVGGAVEMLKEYMDEKNVRSGKACYRDKLYIMADPSGHPTTGCGAKVKRAGPPNGGQFGLPIVHGDKNDGQGCARTKFSLPENWDHLAKSLLILTSGTLLPLPCQHMTSTEAGSPKMSQISVTTILSTTFERI